MNTEISISPGIADTMDDVLRRSNDINSAIDLIRQAICIGVLPSSEDDHVDLIVGYEDGERWESWPLLEAAIDLVNSGEIGMLRQSVTEALAMIPDPA